MPTESNESRNVSENSRDTEFSGRNTSYDPTSSCDNGGKKGKHGKETKKMKKAVKEAENKAKKAKKHVNELKEEIIKLKAEAKCSEKVHKLELKLCEAEAKKSAYEEIFYLCGWKGEWESGSDRKR